MESYHDYLEHARSHKYIRRERTKSGKYRYWYPSKNVDFSEPPSPDKISEKSPLITVVSKGDEVEGIAANGKMFIVNDSKKKGIAINGKMFVDNLLDKMPSITIVSDGKRRRIAVNGRLR